MKKPSALAEMIAKKAFNAPQVLQSWQVHMQAFAPILEPAYADCYTAKIHIINIFNKISRGDVDGAKDVMDTLVKSCGCETNADKALLCFMQGLCHEVSGNKMAMFSMYTQAGYHGHHFYLPHLKNAKFAHESGQLDIALAAYFKGLTCIREMPESAARAKLLGSTLTNAASCMTYMHRYQDAEAALKEARQTGPVPRIEAVEAVLLAALGRKDETETCLSTLAAAKDPAYEHIHDLVQAILEQRDPHFHAQPVAEEAIAAFWQWFEEKEDSLLSLYNQRDEELPDEFLTHMTGHLLPCFPFEHHPLEIAAHEDDEAPELYFFDGYSRSVAEGYSKLFAACPADIAKRWTFTIEN